MRNSSQLKDEPTRHIESLGFNVYKTPVPKPMHCAHTHPDIEINYVLNNTLTYLHGGVRRTFTKGDLVIFWAGIPHQALESPGAENGIWGYFPLLWLLEWKLPNGFASRLLAGEVMCFKLEANRLHKWPMQYGSGNPDLKRLLQLELQTLLMGLAAEFMPGPNAGAGALSGLRDGGERHIASVTLFLAKNYDQPLSIDDIANEVRLNRTYLMHLFRRHCNTSLWEYLTRLRISHAQRKLVTTDLRVIDVALECGFSSLAPFYKAFKRLVGESPLDFKKKSTGGYNKETDQ